MAKAKKKTDKNSKMKKGFTKDPTKMFWEETVKEIKTLNATMLLPVMRQAFHYGISEEDYASMKTPRLNSYKSTGIKAELFHPSILRSILETAMHHAAIDIAERIGGDWDVVKIFRVLRKHGIHRWGLILSDTRKKWNALLSAGEDSDIEEKYGVSLTIPEVEKDEKLHELEKSVLKRHWKTCALQLFLSGEDINTTAICRRMLEEAGYIGKTGQPLTTPASIRTMTGEYNFKVPVFEM